MAAKPKAPEAWNRLSPEEQEERLKNIDVGFRVLKQIDTTEIATGEDILWYCVIDSAMTLDQKQTSDMIEGAEVFWYGNNGDELAGCFAPMIRHEVIEEIAKRHIKRVYFEECCFANMDEEKEAKAYLEMKTPDCDVFIVDFRRLFNRSKTENFDQYRRGYYKALIDAREWFINHDVELKWALMSNAKGYLNCLQAMAEQVNLMMKWGSKAEIRVKLTQPDKVKEKAKDGQERYMTKHVERYGDVEEFVKMCDEAPQRIKEEANHG